MSKFDGTVSMRRCKKCRGQLNEDGKCERCDNFHHPQPLKDVESASTTPTGRPKLLNDMESFAVSCDNAGNGRDALKVRSWIKQLLGVKNIQISYSDYDAWYRRYDHNGFERLGQNFCNTFGIIDSKLFYEQNKKEALGYIIENYVSY